MKKSKLKVLHKKLKEILNELESEIYSDKDFYLTNDSRVTIVEDDDGYTD